MKRILVIALFAMTILAVANAQAQIVTWNLTSSATTATSVNSNLTANSISVVPSTTIAYQTTPGDIYCGSWSTSSSFSTTGKYWEFSITPNYGQEIVISSMTFKAGRTSAGPAKIQVQYSLDGFATSGTTALGETVNANTSALDQFALTSIPPSTSSKITFRIWGYGASGTGNFRLNNIIINGSINSLNAPGSGIGLVSLTPNMFKYNVPTILRFVIQAPGDTINGIRIIKPSVLIWDSNAVSVAPDSVKSTFLGDTIQFADVKLMGQDSLVVTITGVSAVDTINVFSVIIQTLKGTSQYGPVSILPQLFVISSPRPMSQVKGKQTDGTFTLLGKRVVVQGVVTVENEFGGPSYLQDGTAGIAVYDSSVTNNVNRGDEVVLFGVVTSYNGIFELQPCSILEMTSEGNLFDTLTVSMAEIKAQNQKAFEPYECRLIRVNNITSVIQTNGSPATTWATTGSGTNYDLLSGSDTLEIRISSKTNIANTSVPTSKFDLVGVLGQFNTFYQIMPRSYDDIIIEGAGPRITSGVPYESNLTATSITFHFTTDVSGTSIVNYGLTPTYDSTFTDTTKVTNHSATITGLEPATIYNIRLGSTNLGGTTYTSNYIVSTASQTSTGEINVYFNKSVNTAYASHENAQGSVDLTARLITRINAATYSIDACLYNLSGSVGASIAQALVYAKSNRNVKIRVISEKSSTDNAPYSTLTNAGITFINDGFDAINGGAGLMHNKFVVFDNRDTTSDTDDWVWTGSWNQSESGTNSDLQNSIEIQDKALANAYTMEFNEMWGSSGDTPNSSTTRFGARKINNTPHYFSINGTPVELYFSPSDGTTSHIVHTINKAQASIDFCLLTFTRKDIADAMIAKKSSGLRVHGVVDNRTDSGSKVDSLNVYHIDTRIDINSGYLHHKYAVIDAEGGSAANQYVITGSHNWSSNAEYDNDENTLIIHSSRIANLYLQEFAARYKESGGIDSVLASVEQIGIERPSHFSVTQNYPNPFNPTTSFKFSLPISGFVSIKVFDILGREVATLVNEMKHAGVYQVTWNASSLTSGVYFYKIQAGNFTSVRKALLLK